MVTTSITARLAGAFGATVIGIGFIAAAGGVLTRVEQIERQVVVLPTVVVTADSQAPDAERRVALACEPSTKAAL